MIDILTDICTFSYHGEWCQLSLDEVGIGQMKQQTKVVYGGQRACAKVQGPGRGEVPNMRSSSVKVNPR